MARKYIFCVSWIFLLLLKQSYVFTQTYNLSFKHLTVNNGLPVGHVTKLYKDSHGFLWIGTDNGLSRFDGINITNYLTEPKDSTEDKGFFIYNILEDKHNNLWIFTNKAINLYQRSTNRIYTVKKLSGEFASLPTRLIEWVNDSTMIIGLIDDFTLFNIHSFQLKRITLEDGYKILYTTAKPKNMQHWALGYIKNKGLIVLSKQYNEIVKATIPTHNHLSKEFNATAEEMYQQNDSIIWVLSEKGLESFNINSKKFTTYKPDDISNAPRFSVIYKDADKLWVTSTYSGLWLFDLLQKKFIQHWQANISDNTALSYNNISETMLIDNDKNIWLGVFGKGIDYANLYQKKFTHYLHREETEKLKIDNFIRCMARDSIGNVWCGAMNGEVYVLNKNKQPVKQFKIFEKGINFSTANNIAFDKNGRLWLMEDYLYLYNSKKNKFEKIDTNFSYASMLQSKNGKLFFTCGDNSIKELIQAKEKFVIKKTSFEKCIAERSTLFEDKKGRLYVNTVSEGLIVYKSVDDTSVVFKMNHAGIIKCYYETDSVLWMGTNYGLYKIIKPNFKYTVLTSADGLPDNCIYGIEPDMKKNLWLSTNKGICRFTPSTQLFRNYTFNDGLQSNEFNTNGYLMMPDGELWFSGVNGINAFYPSEIVEDNFIPKVQFTGIKVNDINYDNNINDENLLQLNYQNNTVSFNFLGINLYEPNNVQLQYQLAGVDKNWLPANNPGFARYANLKPGRYLFNVKAANIDGFISPALKTIIIEIASPFYMAWWFYLLCILVVASLVYAYTRFRIAQINRLYAVRNRIANDLHDDVGSALSTISLYSEVADLKIDSSLSEVKTIIQKIKNTSQQMQDSMHDIVWNLHHKNDTVEQLLLKLQLFANENTVVKNIHLVFLIDEDVKKIKLQQETRNVVFMVAKEAVNNAMKYSGASKIEICFKHTTGKLLFSIKDNGNGFDINTVKKGHGLSAMNERVDRVKGQILIQSKYGEGTLIEISVAI